MYLILLSLIMFCVKAYPFQPHADCIEYMLVLSYEVGEDKKVKTISVVDSRNLSDEQITQMIMTARQQINDGIEINIGLKVANMWALTKFKDEDKCNVGI